jgi:hypothetical protein
VPEISTPPGWSSQVLALDHHVAKVDADPEHDPPLGWDLCLPLGHAPLHGHGAGDRVDHRGELDQRPVAHQLDDPALVLGQQGIDHLPPQVLKRRQRGGLVLLDQARIADHVGGQDGGEPALGVGLGHGGTLRRSQPAAYQQLASPTRPAGALSSRPHQGGAPSRRGPWGPGAAWQDGVDGDDGEVDPRPRRGRERPYGATCCCKPARGAGVVARAGSRTMCYDHLRS